jgi:hypothetical protein
MLLYPLAIIITFFPIFIERILEIFNITSKALNTIDYANFCLNGFLNSLIYGYFSIIRKRGKKSDSK